MITFLTVVYVICCIFLILVVLLQAGKGGGMGALGGGATQTVFGGAGAGNFLTRLTIINAAMFMTLSATLAYLSSSSEKSLDRAAEVMRLREEALETTEGTTDAPAAGQSTPEAQEGAESEPGAEGIEGLEGASIGDDTTSVLDAVDRALEAIAEPGATAPATRGVDKPSPLKKAAPKKAAAPGTLDRAPTAAAVPVDRPAAKQPTPPGPPVDRPAAEEPAAPTPAELVPPEPAPAP